MSQIAMGLGLVVLVSGAYFVLSVDDPTTKVTSGVLAALGSIISTYISSTFLDVYRGALRQLNRFFNQPLVDNYLLTAERIINLLPVDIPLEAKTKIYSDMIDKILTGTSYPFDQLGQAEGPTRARRRLRRAPVGTENEGKV
jgi:hypothetical protein